MVAILLVRSLSMSQTLVQAIFPPSLSPPPVQSGGLDAFMHLFTLEAMAIARAHVAAIGGNSLLNFRLNDCVLIEHPHKNQVCQ